MEIQIINADKTISKNKILDDINITLKSGKVYGFKGRNGSGKTMLMRLIAGLIYADRGQVIVDGKVLGRDISFPENTGVLIENPAFLKPYTGKDNLKLLSYIKNSAGESEIRSAMERVGLDFNDKRTFRKYSLGMKQRLGIAAALMEKPDLLLLDEPFNALDREGCEVVRNIIREEKERGALIVLACHNFEDLEKLSDEIYEIEAGRVHLYENACNYSEQDEAFTAESVRKRNGCRNRAILNAKHCPIHRNYEGTE